MNGGAIIAAVLARHGVSELFALCGGHISPILIGAENEGIRVVDVRDEKNAVFAADAVGRLSGIPGVAAVTAGPGLTNTITAVKNAQLAQSPLIVFGGATATILRGRGSLQDIDQMSLMNPHVKWATSVGSVHDLVTVVERAFRIAREGVPGPVFIEVPVDLLYDEETVRGWYFKETGVDRAKDVGSKVLKLYLERHLNKVFKPGPHPEDNPVLDVRALDPDPEALEPVLSALSKCSKPVLVVGSQATLEPEEIERLSSAVRKLGLPTYLGGMARGLLGKDDPLQLRHKRGKALKEADLVIVAGFPFDFRLGYGRSINKKATLIAANRSSSDLKKNRRPDHGFRCDPGRFIRTLAEQFSSTPETWASWFNTLKDREAARDNEIEQMASPSHEFVNPVTAVQALEGAMDDDAIMVVDGGDFVATAAYVVKPRAPLSWLDPGVFGTLGVGGGFALGAALRNPGQEVWLIWGDGSSAYSLAEFDTFLRHKLPVIAVVGTDASWAQIAREQVEMLGSACGTELRRTAYHTVAEGYGGKGILVEDAKELAPALAQAKAWFREGLPVLINIQLSSSDFRKGSISM